jgi:putative SOS response-associated peptidase YedK
MCSRFSNTKAPPKFEQSIEIVFRFALLAPRFNIAPTQSAPVMIMENRRVIFTAMRWGLIPHWAKEMPVGNQLVNARVETLREKPSFRQALEQRRCLIPADSYYEWQEDAGKKQPFRVLPKNDEPFCFAGLWERWHRPPTSGQPMAEEAPIVESFTIITMAAPPTLARLHHRMPVIVSPEYYLPWLENKPRDPSFQQALNHSSLAGLRIYPVSQLVNNAAHDDARCFEPADISPDLFEKPWWKE